MVLSQFLHLPVCGEDNENGIRTEDYFPLRVGPNNFWFSLHNDYGSYEDKLVVTEFVSTIRMDVQNAYVKHTQILLSTYQSGFDIKVEQNAYLCANENSYTTNIGMPWVDTDDDNQDGCAEEYEITTVEGRWGVLFQKGVNYYFKPHFSKNLYGETYSGPVYFNVEQNLITQAIGWDKIDTDTYSYTQGGGGGGGPMRYESNLNDLLYIDLETKLVNSKSVVITSTDEPKTRKIRVDNYVFYENTHIEINSYLKNEIGISYKILNDFNINKVPGVITFNQPLDMKEINKFIKKFDISVTKYEGLGHDTEGDEFYFGGTLSGKSNIDFDVVTIEDNEALDGVYAIWGNIPIKSLEKLEKSDIVAFIDTRAFNLHFSLWKEGLALSRILLIDYEIDDLYSHVIN